ncbi:MAG: hypothetical protein SGI72_10985 [Planctomycetota bacterium]|nr:hypothetical protein [Planctomycetota bacterium]
MTNLRLWVVILALVAFLAGVATGPWVSAWAMPPAQAATRNSFDAYERALVETFQLAPERRAPLRAILDEYERDLGRIKDRHMADYMSSMEPDLSKLGRAYREEIRDKVLPAEQRAEFNRLALAPTPNPH